MNLTSPFARKLRTALGVAKGSGWRGVVHKLREKHRIRSEIRNYRRWQATKRRFEVRRRDEMRRAVDAFDRKPLISIIVPVYNIDERWLRLCFESVFRQIYENWELCVADDASTDPHIRPLLEQIAERDERVRICFREKNGHISAASNSALELATGEFCILLDADDVLTEDAVFHIAKVILEDPNVAMVYSDEDMIDAGSNRFGPKFKPDFSPDLFYSLNLVTHLSAYRSDLLRKIGGFRIGMEGSQDYDLALRFIEQIRPAQIRHIPEILYHWRAIPGSVALSGDEKPYAHECARRALRDHFERAGVAAEVEQTHFNLHYVRYLLPPKPPVVSVLVFGSTETEIDEAVNAIGRATEYSDHEIIRVLLNGSIAVSMNRASQSAGDIICFYDAALMPNAEDWLSKIVQVVIQPGVGAVGAKILDEYGLVAGGGLIMGGDDLVSIAHFGFDCAAAGNMERNILRSNFSAVSLNCMGIRRELFERVGGFDEADLKSAYLDADLCLRIRDLGFRIVLDPFSQLRLRPNRRMIQNDPTDPERAFFESRWRRDIDRDPFFNPNFKPGSGAFEIDV